MRRNYFRSTAGRKFNNPSAMYVELTFDNTPVIDITRAPLLYNKKVFFGFRFDDTYKNAFVNSKAVFLGGVGNLDENNNKYLGKRYTDGCGNDLPYTADFAIQMSVVAESSSSSYLSNADLTRAKNYGYGILPQGCHITQKIDIGNPDSNEPYEVWAADCQEFMDECFARFKFRPTVSTSDYGRDEWTTIQDSSNVWHNPMREAGCLFFTSGKDPKELAGIDVPNDIINGLNALTITNDSFVGGLPFPCLYTSSRILKFDTVSNFPSTPDLNTIYHSIETGLEYRYYDDKYFAVTAIKRYSSLATFPSTGVADAIYVDTSNYNCYNYESGYVLLTNVESYSTLPTPGTIGTIYRDTDTNGFYRWSTELNSYYTLQESFANSRPVNQIRDMITNAINGTVPRIFSIFTHQLSFEQDDNDNGGYYLPYWIKDYIDWLDQYSKTGTDQIIVASMNTIAEYLYCRENAIINTYPEGNKVILEIIAPTDRSLRRPALTLILNTNIPVVETAIVNIDRFSQNVVGNTSGIINVEWSDEWYNTANEAVTTAENTQLQADVDEAAYFISLVSNINKYNSLMARLNAIVVIADISHLIDFSRNVSTYISSAPYNDIHDFSPTSSNVVILDVSGVDNGIRFNFLTNSYSTYYKTDVITTGIHPDIVRKDGVQISSSGPIGTFSLSNLDPTKTYSLKFYGYKAYSTGARGLADIRVYNSKLVNSTDITQEYDPSNNLTTTCDFANVEPNEDGNIFIDITATNGVTTVMSALEIIKHNS